MMNLKRNRFLAAVLALLLAAGVPVLPALAVEPAICVSADDVSATLAPGGAVRVPVRAADNDGFIVGGVLVAWDAAALKLKSVDFTGSVTQKDSPAAVTGTEEKYFVPFGDADAAADNTATGLLFTLEFEILSGAAAKTYEITLSKKTGAFLNLALEDLTPAFTSGKVTLTAPEPEPEPEPEPQPEPEPETPRVNPFADVGEADYCYDAVLWAYYAKPFITNGKESPVFAADGTLTAPGLFGPGDTVTRGQAVTFLWRAMGCPEPTNTENPFEDVWETDYWYKAILWAVEKGIVKGTDATHYTPYQTCSTAHIVTFLFRTLGIGPDGWYQEAGNWATEKGLLKDMGLTVGQGVPCPRGSVVTFLYRALIVE